MNFSNWLCETIIWLQFVLLLWTHFQFLKPLQPQSLDKPCQYNYSYTNIWDRLCQTEITGKYAIKLLISIHRPQTKIEREVEILCNKPSPSKSMHGIKWRICETILCLHLCGRNWKLWAKTLQKSMGNVTAYWSSLLVGDLIADKGDPDGRNVQTGLADPIG
jgi:hypothetical protein